MVPFRRRPAPSALPVLATLAASLCAGCAEEEVPVVTIFHPTLVEVSPVEFLGGVPCVDARGAMRRYVATVYDVGKVDPADAGAVDVENAFALPSSTVAHGDVDGDGMPDATPTPCNQTVGFSRVIGGNGYFAEIDAYDRDDLIALAPGTRILYDPVTSERVEPRWKTSCSKPDPGAEHPRPVVAYGGIVRTIGICEPLVDATPGTETSIEVSIDGALGELECGDTPGAVQHFEVTPPGEAAISAACGETMSFPPPEGSGTSLSLPLRAFEAGASEPSWVTTCVAQVLPGVTTTATCLPLVAEGASEVDPEESAP